MAEAVGDLARVLGVPDHEVGALPGGQHAAVVQTQRARGMRRDAMFSISSRLRQGDDPGLWSVAMAIGTPASRSAATGGSFVSRRK